jgi:hypothetical protein
MNTLTSQQIDLIETVAKELLHANNTITTLEIKDELRKKHPHSPWWQFQISETMAFFADQGIFNYTDNGSYRTYFDPKNPINPNPFKKSTKVKVQITNGGVIDVNTTKQLIENSKGKIFSITFTKLNKDNRKMVCRYLKDLNDTKLDFLMVKDMAEAKKGQAYNAIRRVKYDTISEISINKTKYTVV